MRVAQLPGERGLVQELRAVDRAELRVAEHLGLDGLQRDFPAGKRVAREVDRSGRALAQQLLDIVFADLKGKVERETAGAFFLGVCHLGFQPCKLSANVPQTDA